MFDVWLKVGRSRVRCPGQRLIPNCDPKMSILWLYQTVECHTGYTLTNTPTTFRLFLREVWCIIAHPQAKVNWKVTCDTGNQTALLSSLNMVAHGCHYKDILAMANHSFARPKVLDIQQDQKCQNVHGQVHGCWIGYGHHGLGQSKQYFAMTRIPFAFTYMDSFAFVFARLQVNKHLENKNRSFNYSFGRFCVWKFLGIKIISVLTQFHILNLKYFSIPLILSIWGCQVRSIQLRCHWINSQV